MPNTQQSTDAIVLLKDDHKEIRKTFADFEKAGDNAEKTKAALVDKMIELLTVHTYIENEVMYPRVRALLPDLEDDILESYEEHHVADVLVMELSAMSASTTSASPPRRRSSSRTSRTTSRRRRTTGSPRCARASDASSCRRSVPRWSKARKKAPRKPSQPSALKKTIDAVIA